MWTKIKLILSALSTIKNILSMVTGLFDKYKENKRVKRKEEIKESIDVAIDSKDQREFEKAIGSSNAGKPTKHKLDSLQKRPKKDRS